MVKLHKILNKILSAITIYNKCPNKYINYSFEKKFHQAVPLSKEGTRQCKFGGKGPRAETSEQYTGT